MKSLKMVEKGKEEFSFHRPVLLKEAVDLLAPKKGGVYLDGTAGSGGHSEEILKRIAPTGRLIAIDIDPFAVKRLEERLLPRYKECCKIVHGNFASFENYLEKDFLLDGVLLDLGVSADQIFSPERGFSFRFHGPLNMRMDCSENFVSAWTVVNTYPFEDLVRIFEEYGEERFGREIAEEIVKRRKKKPIEYTDELAEIVSKFYRRRGRIHPATKVFQAIRIEVNGEIENLKVFLGKIPYFIKKNGRIVIISFHSIEDRIVKTQFKAWECYGWGKRILNKPLMPSLQEISENPRARSAKLRAFEFYCRNG
jgi:16S rRNA (cytosine1402-N4)-methyltransferase